MKLKNDFFCIKDACQTETGINYTIGLNPEHFIYQVHFPNNPVTPGVYIIQIIQELLEEVLERTLFMKKLHNGKFLNVINPLENNEVIFSISISSEGNDAHKISAVVSNENHQFAKLSMLFVNQ